jgi:hypothetical protein
MRLFGLRNPAIDRSPNDAGRCPAACWADSPVRPERARRTGGCEGSGGAPNNGQTFHEPHAVGFPKYASTDRSPRRAPDRVPAGTGCTGVSSPREKSMDEPGEAELTRPPRPRRLPRRGRKVPPAPPSPFRGWRRRAVRRFPGVPLYTAWRSPGLARGVFPGRKRTRRVW